MRPAQRPLALLVLLAAFVLVGCKNARTDTLNASFVALNAARDGYFAWDLAKQRAIEDAAAAAGKTNAEVKAEASAFRVKTQLPVVKGLQAAYAALSAAALASDQPSVDAAVKAAREIISKIASIRGGS